MSWPMAVKGVEDFCSHRRTALSLPKWSTDQVCFCLKVRIHLLWHQALKMSIAGTAWIWKRVWDALPFGWRWHNKGQKRGRMPIERVREFYSRYFDAWCAQSGWTTCLSGSGSGGDGGEPNGQTQCTVFVSGYSLQMRSTTKQTPKKEEASKTKKM